MNEAALPPRWLAVAEHVASLFACVAALHVVAGVASPILARLDYPGDLEWMEGATLITAERLRDGLPIYGEPAPDYIPFIYPPLYAWVLAQASQLWPLGYTLGRAVSLASIVLAAAAGAYAARKNGATWIAAGSSVGLLAACWDDSGTFYDLVRTDSISLALLAWAIVLADGPSPRWSLASGLLLALAFAAKQHAALVGIPIGLYTWWAFGWRRARNFALASAGPAILYSVGMIAVTGGAYWTWIATIATEHGIVVARAVPGAQIECFEALPVLTAAVFLVPFWLWKRPYWTAITLTLLVIVSLMRGHTGGYLNVLMPVFWVLSVLPFVAAGAVPGALGGRVARTVGSLLVAVQLVVVQVDVARFREGLADDLPIAAAWDRAAVRYTRYVPSPQDRELVEKIVDELRKLPDPILIPHAPWYARMAEKRTSFALITLWDIDHKGGRYAPQARAIESQLAAGYFPSAVVPDDKLGHGFKDHFRKVRALQPRTVGTRTGWSVRLKSIWEHVPPGEPEAPEDAPTAP